MQERKRTEPRGEPRPSLFADAPASSYGCEHAYPPGEYYVGRRTRSGSGGQMIGAQPVTTWSYISSCGCETQLIKAAPGVLTTITARWITTKRCALHAF